VTALPEGQLLKSHMLLKHLRYFNIQMYVRTRKRGAAGSVALLLVAGALEGRLDPPAGMPLTCGPTTSERRGNSALLWVMADAAVHH
jgi:hypothetical protein